MVQLKLADRFLPCASEFVHRRAYRAAHTHTQYMKFLSNCCEIQPNLSVKPRARIGNTRNQTLCTYYGGEYGTVAVRSINILIKLLSPTLPTCVPPFNQSYLSYPRITAQPQTRLKVILHGKGKQIDVCIYIPHRVSDKSVRDSETGTNIREGEGRKLLLRKELRGVETPTKNVNFLPASHLSKIHKHPKSGRNHWQTFTRMVYSKNI